MTELQGQHRHAARQARQGQPYRPLDDRTEGLAAEDNGQRGKHRQPGRGQQEVVVDDDGKAPGDAEIIGVECRVTLLHQVIDGQASGDQESYEGQDQDADLLTLDGAHV
jgi:hypothetical protein